MSGKVAPDYASTFPLLPLRGGVLFPVATMAYEIGRAKTVALAEHVAANRVPFVVVVPQRVAKVEDPGASDLHEIGTLARVVGVEKREGGNYGLLVTGLARVRLTSVESATPFLQARVEEIPTPAAQEDDELTALAMGLRESTAEIVQSMPGVPRDVVARLKTIEAPQATCADFVATYLDAGVDEKVDLLGIVEPKERVAQALGAASVAASRFSGCATRSTRT